MSVRHFDLVFVSTWPVVFDGGALETRPLGGSETAIVELARRFAAGGRRVAVMCRVPGGAVTYDGVLYMDVEEGERAFADGAFRAGTLYLSRDATLAPWSRFARRTHLWMQDMPMDGLKGQHLRALPHLDRFVVVSRFQRDCFVTRFGLPVERFFVTRNGIDAARYRPWGARVRGRLIYCSTPFRGLAVLLEAFTRIHRALPWTTLDVYSGMCVYDQTDAPFEDLYRKAEATPGVRLIRPVPQPALIQALREAELMTYPATFNETSCIAAMMAIGAGAVPVTSDRAGLPETVGDAGLLVAGDGRRDPEGYAERYADAVVALLERPEEIARLRAVAATRELDWEPVVAEWSEALLAGEDGV